MSIEALTPAATIADRLEALLPDEVRLAVVDDDDGSLHPEEDALVDPRATASYRRDFRRGRMAARRALAQIGVGPTPIRRGTLRQPLWPHGIVGSIAHHDGVAVAAVARHSRIGGLGIDVEGRTDVRDIASHIAFGDELRWLDTAPSDGGRSRRIIELFSAKESVYKAFFPRVGRIFGFDGAHLQRIDDHSFVGRLLPPLHGVPGAGGFRVACRWVGAHVLTWVVLPPVSPDLARTT